MASGSVWEGGGLTFSGSSEPSFTVTSLSLRNLHILTSMMTLCILTIDSGKAVMTF